MFFFSSYHYLNMQICIYENINYVKGDTARINLLFINYCSILKLTEIYILFIYKSTHCKFCFMLGSCLKNHNNQSL